MKPIDALDDALAQRDQIDAQIRDIKAQMPGWPERSPMIKGLSPEEWTDAAVASLTDDALKLMTQTVASLFKTLKNDAIRRGIWEEISRKKVG